MKIINKIVTILLIITAIISLTEGNTTETLLLFISALLVDLPNQLEEMIKNIKN